jgi:hypothetical protein
VGGSIQSAGRSGRRPPVRVFLHPGHQHRCGGVDLRAAADPQAAGAAIAVALLAEESQILAIAPPDRIAVALVKGGKVFVAVVGAKTKLAPIAACDAIWTGFKAKSEAAFAAYQASELKDQKSFDAGTRFESDGADALHKCWAERARGEPAFPALTRQAQALADLFASR